MRLVTPLLAALGKYVLSGAKLPASTRRLPFLGRLLMLSWVIGPMLHLRAPGDPERVKPASFLRF